MKLGIALGGGGAKGFAHIGVLQVLQEAGIHCDIVAGTSIGALVGVVYSSGQLSGLADAAAKIGLKDIPSLLTPTISAAGLFSGDNALKLFERFIEAENIEQLPNRFAAVSVDLVSGEIVSLTSGPIRNAVRASFAIPVLFTPIQFENKILVDGGLLDPLPVQAARNLGADIVVAVDLFGHQSSPLPNHSDGIHLNPLNYLKKISTRLPFGNLFSRWSKPTKTGTNIIAILESTLSASQRQLTNARLESCPADILIQPNVSNIGLLDFHRGTPGIEQGAAAARVLLPQLLQILGK